MVLKFATNNNRISIQGAQDILLKGETHFVNIQFRHTAQLRFKNNQLGKKLVSGCSFQEYQTDVILATDSRNISIIDNQIVMATGAAVRFEGSHNHTQVKGNLILGTDNGVFFEKVPQKQRNQTTISVEGNVFVGIKHVGIDGFQHNNRSMRMQDNLIGVAGIAVRFVSSEDASLVRHVIYRCELGVEHLEMNSFETEFSKLLMVANRQYFRLSQKEKSYRNIIVRLQTSLIQGYGLNQRDCSKSRGIGVYQPNIKNYINRKNSYQLSGMNLNNAVMQLDRVQLENFDTTDLCKENRMFALSPDLQDSMQVFVTATQFTRANISLDQLNYPANFSKNFSEVCGKVHGCTGNQLVLFSLEDGKQLISHQAHSQLSNDSVPACTNAGSYFACQNKHIQMLQFENWKFFSRQFVNVTTQVGKQTNSMIVNSVKGLKIGKYVYDRQIW